jgi:hypothetical protein
MLMKKQLNTSVAIYLLLGLLLLVGLACNQAGEILTPAEATARAEGAKIPTRAAATPNAAEKAADFQAGDTVEFIGSGHLIPMYKQPGDTIAFSYAGKGETATVLGFEEVEGSAWFEIKGGAGQGWVKAEYLMTPEGETEDEAGGEPTAEGPQIGDTVTLVGTGYLITLVDAPGATRMQAVQERGVEVTILNIGEYEGELWYMIDAPTGEGWVKAENISMEAP